MALLLLPPAHHAVVCLSAAQARAARQPHAAARTHCRYARLAELAPGLQLHNALSTGTLFGQLIALRFDPQRYRLRAHYQPGHARTLEGWLEALPGVVAFINANFFSGSLLVNGLLVADGIAHGQPWLTRGGTLLVRDGLPLLRPSREQPWQIAPRWIAAAGGAGLPHAGAGRQPRLQRA